MPRVGCEKQRKWSSSYKETAQETHMDFLIIFLDIIIFMI